MKKTAFASACAVAALLLTSLALAGPADDKANARTHPIATGDIGAIITTYMTRVTLHWVGGPLDGTYGSC